jgi:hypothetical protein
MSSDVVGQLFLVRFGCLMSCVVVPVPYGGGVHLPFIDQGEGELQTCRTIQLHGEVWRVTPQSRRPA